MDHVTWQTGLVWTEEVGQTHGLQLLLQGETVVQSESRDLHRHTGLLHVPEPVVEFVQVQNGLHLQSHGTSLWCSTDRRSVVRDWTYLTEGHSFAGQNDDHGDVVSAVRHLQHLDLILREILVPESVLLVHHADWAGSAGADVEILLKHVVVVELVFPLTLKDTVGTSGQVRIQSRFWVLVVPEYQFKICLQNNYKNRERRLRLDLSLGP